MQASLENHAGNNRMSLYLGLYPVKNNNKTTQVKVLISYDYNN